MPDRYDAYPRLSDAHLALLERLGSRRRVVPGDTLYRDGDPGYEFQVILSGAVAIVEDLGRADQRVISVHGERRFLGELDLFSGHPVSVTALVIRAGEVIHVPDDRLKAAFAADHGFKELVLRTFLLRRARLLELAADLRIVGHPGSPDTRQLQEYANANRLTAAVVDLESDGIGERLLAELDISEADQPVVVLRTGRVLRNPDEAELTQALRARDSGSDTRRFDETAHT